MTNSLDGVEIPSYLREPVCTSHRPVRTVRQPCAATRCSDGVVAPRLGELIKGPQDAINVFDFEPVAYKNVPPAGLSPAFVRKA
jgi:hypothetical protein